MHRFPLPAVLRSRAAPAALLAALALPAAASAAPFSIVTTGTISVGSDPSNLLGAGTSLAGDAYTLTVSTSGLDPSYFSGGGTAADNSTTLPGSITLTVAGHTLVTNTLTAITFLAQEDTFGDVVTVASGLDAAGNSAEATQSIEANSGFLTAAMANLQTPFSYTLRPGDLGGDTYTFSNAAFTGSLSFTGTPATVALVVPVPEPASWGLLGLGVLGLAAAVRRGRGRAVPG